MIPALIFVLSVVWMQLVKGKTTEESEKEETKRDINFEQAYLVSPENQGVPSKESAGMGLLFG